MILQALAQYYDQLVQQGVLERPGWQAAKVSFALRIGEDGALCDVVDLRRSVASGKKTVLVPQTINVPEQVKRSSGIAANFLCENTSYMLGFDQKGKPERSRLCFEACAALHHQLLDGVEHPMAKAILRFFDRWSPENAASHERIAPHVKDLNAANLIFVMDGQYAQEVPEIAAAWQAHSAEPDASAMQMRCLVTGETAPVARLHPSIRGVQGAQSSGASLVSFNAPAFESYGRDGGQGLNAPVSERAAFAYGAALNHLIADREHVVRFGDTTVLFWAEDADIAPVDMMCDLLGVSDAMTNEELRDIMRKLERGEAVDLDALSVDCDNRFYILGLAPNAARLSVRFFMQDQFGAFLQNVMRHHERMRMVRPAYDAQEYLPVWKMLLETVNPNSRDKSPSPHMAGDVLRAILGDSLYPTTLYEQVQVRIRAEREITRGKAAIIKAYLTKNVKDRDYITKGVLDMKLNDETTYMPYVLGRMFALLEALQDKANPGINTTIRDRYFTSACCTPALVFPTLINLAQAHLKKIDERSEVYFSKQLTELMNKLDESYPKQLDIYDQGIFQLGYYHQTQKRYEKKEEKDNG